MRKLTSLITLLTLILTNYTSKAQNNMSSQSLVTEFTSDFTNYKMDIQSAGIANIPVASFSKNGELYIRINREMKKEMVK